MGSHEHHNRTDERRSPGPQPTYVKEITEARLRAPLAVIRILSVSHLPEEQLIFERSRLKLCVKSTAPLPRQLFEIQTFLHRGPRISITGYGGQQRRVAADSQARNRRR